MFEYIWLFVVLLMAAMFVAGSVQMRNIRNRSQEWVEIEAEVVNTQGYEGQLSLDLEIEYTFNKKYYRAWTSNAFELPTQFVQISDRVRAKIDPEKPSKSVLVSCNTLPTMRLL